MERVDVVQRTAERLVCPARPHGRLYNDRTVISVRCTDPACPDAVYARMHDLICIHYWNLNDPNLYRWSDFEPRQKRVRS